MSASAPPPPPSTPSVADEKAAAAAAAAAADKSSMPTQSLEPPPSYSESSAAAAAAGAAAAAAAAPAPLAGEDLELPPAYSDVTIYEDRYCLLTPAFLKIKLYFFPFGNKTIPYTDIERIEVAGPDNAGFLMTKSWGMAVSDVWWACDMRFRFPRSECALIVRAYNDGIGKGFSTEDRPRVLKLLQQLVARAREDKHAQATAAAAASSTPSKS